MPYADVDALRPADPDKWLGCFVVGARQLVGAQADSDAVRVREVHDPAWRAAVRMRVTLA